AAVVAYQSLDLEVMDAPEVWAVVRRAEVVRRQMDHGTDRLAGHVDRTGAYGVDGHRNAKAALVHLGRLPGPEATQRLSRARALRWLPCVADAYRRGAVPTASVRAIARVASNPRVRPFLEGADAIFAEQAATEAHGDLVSWLGEWERLADADGAAQRSEITHARRRATLVQDPSEQSFALTATFGALQGATFAEIFDRFVDAEHRTDLAEARARLGRDDVAPDELARTPAQRRADALVAMAHRAATAPPEGRRPEPLVNIVIDQASFETELARLAGADTPAPDTIDPTGRVCHTLSGYHLHPGDAVAAAVIGHVRRVVVDAKGTVIDLGRKQRCFTGAARDAVLLNQSLNGGPPRCMWPGCDRAVRHLQIDHVDPWRAGGPTDTTNGWPGCGYHNRLKEAGFIPHREPDGTWTYHRPNGGGPITAAA
ncbi:MAG TPA: DUF222 domain-containing protein, partial [Acidimicrobiales bacterium]|nr:DUF222 domain-containing protein [Acidimicrobiales bacterium]